MLSILLLDMLNTLRHGHFRQTSGDIPKNQAKIFYILSHWAIRRQFLSLVFRAIFELL